jgi:hypothetical protein
MKTEMTTYECAKALTHDEYANWTRSAAFALVEYLEQIEEDCGTSIEFDPVALRCEFSEYESLQHFAQQYWPTNSQRLTRDEVIKEYIEHRSTLIEFDGGIIVQDF